MRNNVDWLNKNEKSHSALADGVAFQFASAINDASEDLLPSQVYDNWKAATGDLSLPFDFARVCRFLDIPEGDDNSADKTSLSSAVYFRTPISDRAYMGFSSYFHELGASYQTDFKSACEDVYYDRADACILPLESSDDGLLMTFRHMLLKYELKIIAVVRISSGDDSYQTMALLTNTIMNTDGNICEFYLPSSNHDDIVCTCRSLEILGAKVRRITSVPARNSSSYDHHICMKADPHKVIRIKYFLDAMYPANILLGQYKII